MADVPPPIPVVTPEQQLAELKEQLRQLKNSMASGILRLEDADTGTVQNRTYPEMRMARADLEKSIRDLEAEISPLSPRQTRRIVIVGRSGW